MATKPDTSRQGPHWKPLSHAQEAAITRYLAGHSDADMAAAVGVTRQPCNAWRHQHVLFIIELEKRRADLWRASAERLRSSLTTAVDNLLEAVDSGDLNASIALLNAVDRYGNGATNPISVLDPDPETLIRRQAEAQADREGVACDSLTAMMEHMNTAAWRHRVAEVEAEFRRTYVEDEPPEPTKDWL